MKILESLEDVAADLESVSSKMLQKLLGMLICGIHDESDTGLMDLMTVLSCF